MDSTHHDTSTIRLAGWCADDCATIAALIGVLQKILAFPHNLIFWGRHKYTSLWLECLAFILINHRTRKKMQMFGVELTQTRPKVLGASTILAAAVVVEKKINQCVIYCRQHMPSVHLQCSSDRCLWSQQISSLIFTQSWMEWGNRSTQFPGCLIFLRMATVLWTFQSMN